MKIKYIYKYYIQANFLKKTRFLLIFKTLIDIHCINIRIVKWVQKNVYNKQKINEQI